MSVLFITGGAGNIGQVIRRYLLQIGHTLISSDIVEFEPFSSDEKTFKVDILNSVELEDKMQGAECIIHLAGIPQENYWQPILENNIQGTYQIFETARKLNISKIIFASSNHVTGFYPVEKTITSDFPVKPDTLYGVSKVCGEALGSFFADKYGLSIANLRIGAFVEKPFELCHLYMWISHRDLCHLIDRCINANYRFITLYGVSANTRNFWDNGETAAKIGYTPQDNAELYKENITPTEAEKNNPIVKQFQGGIFCTKTVNPE